MRKRVDLVGQRFGRLQVIEKDIITSNKKNKAHWICMCDCGNRKTVSGSSLKSGNVKSCGCLRREESTKRAFKHGLVGNPIYAAYNRMLQRCEGLTYSQYKDYGGRGIKVCDEWKESPPSFYEWAQNNGYKEGLTLDRIDVNGEYSPKNCRWATMKEQQNNRRNNNCITYRNETRTLQQWSEFSNIPYATLRARLMYYGWSEERALTTPVRKHK